MKNLYEKIMEDLKKAKVKVVIYVVVAEYRVNCDEAHETKIEKVFITHEQAVAYIKQREDFMYEVHKREQLARKLRNYMSDIFWECHYLYDDIMKNKDQIMLLGIKSEDYIDEKTYDRYSKWETDLDITKEVLKRYKHFLVKMDSDMSEVSEKDIPYIFECNNNDGIRNFGEYSAWSEEKEIE